PDVRRDVDVVEADHRQLLRHTDAERPRGLERSERLRVGRGEDRSRTLRQRQQLGGDSPCDVEQTCALADVVGPNLDPGALQCTLVPAGAVAAPVEAELGRRVADVRYPAVTELDEVARRRLAAADVVDGDRRERWMNRVDEDAREAGVLDPLDLLL